MSLLKTNEIQNYNGSSLTLTASTVSTSAQLNTGGNISVTGSLNVSDDSTTRTNLGLGTIATQDSDSITVTGGTATLGALTVSGSDSGNLVRITQTGSGNALVVEDSANPDSTPFVVDASGNVGIGVSGVNAPLDVDKAPLFNNCVANFGEFIALADYQRGVVNINGRVNGTDNDASLNFVRRNAGNSNWLNGLIALDSAGSIYFSTGGVGNSASTERMRIDSSGDVNISNLSASSDVQTDASKNLITTSDARLKNDLGVITDSAINVVQQIIPKYFSWKNDENNNQQLGFFAQDIYPVLPEAAPRALKYTEVGRDENDEPILEQVFDEDGNPDYEWGFTDRPIIAMCVKAIQEQQTIIESQQSQIDALTARIEALETT